MKVDSARKNTGKLIKRPWCSGSRVKVCQHSMEPFPAMQHLPYQRPAHLPQVYFTTATIFAPPKKTFHTLVRMSGKKSRKEPRKEGKEEGVMMAALQKKTSLTASQIKEQHHVFKKICPQGLVILLKQLCLIQQSLCFLQMTKKQFLDNSVELLGEEGSFMAERLFK